MDSGSHHHQLGANRSAGSWRSAKAEAHKEAFSRQGPAGGKGGQGRNAPRSGALVENALTGHVPRYSVARPFEVEGFVGCRGGAGNLLTFGAIGALGGRGKYFSAGGAHWKKKRFRRRIHAFFHPASGGGGGGGGDRRPCRWARARWCACICILRMLMVGVRAIIWRRPRSEAGPWGNMIEGFPVMARGGLQINHGHLGARSARLEKTRLAQHIERIAGHENAFGDSTRGKSVRRLSQPRGRQPLGPRGLVEGAERARLGKLHRRSSRRRWGNV